MGAITKLCKTKDWAEQYPHHKTKANQKWFRITKHDQRQRNTQKEYAKTPVKTYLHVPSRITIPNRGQVTLYFFQQFENLSRWMKYYWMLMVAICRWVSPLLAPENHQAFPHLSERLKGVWGLFLKFLKQHKPCCSPPFLLKSVKNNTGSGTHKDKKTGFYWQ